MESIEFKQADLALMNTNLGEKCETLNTKVNTMKDQIDSDKVRFTEQQQKEFSVIRDEMNHLRTYPAIMTSVSQLDGRENIDFRTYKRNPIEFLERVEEAIARNRENRWPVIKNMLDEYFKNVHDNWWTAIRHEVQNYTEFKAAFRTRYWSESAQNIVRDNISNGKYDPSAGTTMTAYFLGKICVARNLEPTIPEECLITKLAYHFHESISQARLNNQIKTTQAMLALLENHEHERYYQRNRQRIGPYYDRSGPGNNNNNRGNFQNPNRYNDNQNTRPPNNNNQHNGRGDYNHNQQNNTNNQNNNYRPNNNHTNFRPNNNYYRPNNNNGNHRPYNGNNNNNNNNFRRVNYAHASRDNNRRYYYQGRRSYNGTNDRSSSNGERNESGYNTRRSRSSEDQRGSGHEREYRPNNQEESREDNTPHSTERDATNGSPPLNQRRQ